MIKNDNYKHADITEKVIKAFYKVYNTLGYGFLEKVYENALFLELKSSGLFVEKQKRIEVFYAGTRVGVYYADLIISESVIVELKAAENLCEEHEFQLINYLKATDIEVGLLLNFGKSPQCKRKVFTNESNHNLSKEPASSAFDFFTL
jgi:GxxExxY protein